MSESSIHLVDPQLLPLLAALPAVRVDTEGLGETRGIFAAAAAAALGESLQDGVVRSEIWIPGTNPLRAFIYRPSVSAAARPALLHAHSGGYVLGSPEARDGANRYWAAELGSILVSIDYRLAPEHPYPAALEDAMQALCWLHGEANTLGIDRDRIGLIGESAGGGLCAGLSLLARDKGGPTIAAQILAYPMLDDRTRDVLPSKGEFVWKAEDNDQAWTAYLGGADTTAYAAPARAENLRGLPPTALFIGDLDLFCGECLAFASRLSASGVPLDLHVYPGAFHAFDAAPGTDVGASFRQHVLTSAKRWIVK